MNVLVRSVILALALGASAVALPACSKSSEVSAENIEEQGALTEQHEAAAVVWAVTPDGQVKALVKTPDGKPIEKEVSGTLNVKPFTKDAAPTKAELKFDGDAKLLSGTIPKLEADLTEVGYELQVEGKPLKGVLHLPRGGTKELTESAKVTAEAKIPADKKGPNGGVIQVIGEDTVEVVADKKTGAVRVYVLNDNLKPIAVGDRKVKLALGGDKPEMVELTPEPKGLFFTGKLTVKINPTKITVVIIHKDVTHVALCGWHPGKVIIIGPSAPVFPLFVVVNWDVDINVKPVIVHHDDDDDDDDGPVIIIGKGKHKHKHKHKHHHH